MSRKERMKRQKMIRAYVARAIVALVLIIMLVLMFCGCLYIRDLFKKEDTSQAETNSQIAEEDATKEEPASTGGTDTDSDVEEPESYEQYPGFCVVVDPGHGGNDGGTVCPEDGIVEKEINLAVSKEVTSLLEKHGVDVILTRDYDDYMSLEERAYFASQQTADLFISLHCNFFEGDESITGLEAFYCKKDADSRIFAENIAKAVSKQSEIALRGATENNYYVTKHAGMDAILIEMGFLSNPVECEKLASPDYHKLLAESIVEGILTSFDAKN